LVALSEEKKIIEARGASAGRTEVRGVDGETPGKNGPSRRRGGIRRSKWVLRSDPTGGGRDEGERKRREPGGTLGSHGGSERDLMRAHLSCPKGNCKQYGPPSPRGWSTGERKADMTEDPEKGGRG